MQTFRYKARDSGRKMIEGSLEAETDQDALEKLNRMGYFPLSVHRDQALPSALAPAPGRSFGLFGRIRRRDIAFVSRQLADLLGSGLALMRALDVLREQSENPRLREVLTDVVSQVKTGKSLSEALAAYPKFFSPLYVSMVRSGEVGGMLEGVLARLADFAETEEELLVKLRSALAYPVLICLVGMGTVAVLLIFVIPKLVTLFEDVGQVLPLPTRILITLSHGLASYWWLIGAVAMSGVLVVRRWGRSAEGRLALDRLKLRLPVVGALIKKVEIARCARSLGTLLSHGVPILKALQVVAEATGNALLRGELEQIGDQLKRGGTLSRGLRGGRLFPPLVTHMVAVGEESGTLDRALFRIADTYEREADRAMKLMTSLVEPVMILTMGSLVAFIVISMLLPIFSIDLLAR
jgi:type II secretion system protein F